MMTNHESDSDEIVFIKQDNIADLSNSSDICIEHIPKRIQRPVKENTNKNLTYMFEDMKNIFETSAPLVQPAVFQREEILKKTVRSLGKKTGKKVTTKKVAVKKASSKKLVEIQNSSKVALSTMAQHNKIQPTNKEPLNTTESDVPIDATPLLEPIPSLINNQLDTQNLNEILIKSDINTQSYWMKEDDTLEDVFKSFNIKKLKYKGALVSKYLTLKEIGYNKKNKIFEVVESILEEINIKVNINYNKTDTIKVDVSKTILDIIGMYGKGDLVLNGVILDRGSRIKDVVEGDDVVDLVCIED